MAKLDRSPGWVRPALTGLLVVTAALYAFELTANGYANPFYAAAAQAGTESVKAWLFGSLDSGNFITVDKPPAALWLMVLSCRIFGFSSFALLLPQVMAGVATVALTYAGVRRWAGPVAGLVAGALLSLTPVAALMFRFDNPDALLTLLLTLAAYWVIRATDAAGRAAAGWMLLVGGTVGLGFLTKMGQALLVVPALVLVCLIASSAPLTRRFVQLGAAAAALFVSAGWYIALVAWWPAGSRPYIGGSTDNSLWQLAIGYNGVGRLFGRSTAAAPAATSAGGLADAAGPARMFGAAFGPEISWLLPAALIGLLTQVWFTRRPARTDRTRAALIVWGGWLVSAAVVLSFLQGTAHSYYAVVMAPPVAAVTAVTGQQLWRARDSAAARWVLASMIACTGFWGFVLLDRSAPGWWPALRWIGLFGSSAGAVCLLLTARWRRRAAFTGLVLGALAGVIGMAAITLATVATVSTGAFPTSGPRVHAGRPVFTPSPALVDLLDATTSTWAAAVNGSNNAAILELATTHKAVMGIGGYTWTDPAPTLARFTADVSAGRITYYVISDLSDYISFTELGPAAQAYTETQIESWVTKTFTHQTLGRSIVYDLRSAR